MAAVPDSADGSTERALKASEEEFGKGWMCRFSRRLNRESTERQEHDPDHCYDSSLIQQTAQQREH